MKKILPFILLIVMACSGCASNYTIVLNNGDVLTSRGKPRYDASRGTYYFTDAAGHPGSVSASRVREVAPSNMADKSGPQFLK
jgi:hypothetical protein